MLSLQSIQKLAGVLYGKSPLVKPYQPLYPSTDYLTKAQARAEAIEVLNLTITHQAGEEGKLFGSVGLPDIIKACADAGVEVDKQEIKLPEGSIRQTGEFEVAIHLHTDVVASLKLAVVAEA